MVGFKKKGNSAGFRNNKLIYALIAALMVVAFVLTLTIIRGIAQTETYYVLKEDVPTRSQVTPEMLTPVTTSAGSAPRARSVADVQGGTIFTKFPLTAGDVLTDSNSGAREDISTGVPDNWVITSFSVMADDAVGGRIRRGVYFDVMVVDDTGSYYPFVNMLALDTTVSLNNASSNQAAETQEAAKGQTTQYVVGLPPDQAAELQTIAKKGGIKLLLSPRQNEYNQPRLADYAGTFKYSGNPKNAGKGTDYSFTPLKRDAFGRPMAQEANCSQGNARIDAKVCADAGAAPTSNPTTTDN